MMDASKSGKTIKFIPFPLFVNSNFWYKLADKKLVENKGNEVTNKLWGYCTAHENLFLDYSSFNKKPSEYLGKPFRGYQLDKISRESFDDENILHDFIEKLCEDTFEDIQKGNLQDDFQNLIPFVMYTFCDIKSYKFYYRMCYVTPKDDYFFLYFDCSNSETVLFDEGNNIMNIYKDLPASQPLMYFIRSSPDGKNNLVTVQDFLSSPEQDNSEMYLCFRDPIASLDNASLIVRNGLFFLLVNCSKLFNFPFKCILWKDIDERSNTAKKYVLCTVKRTDKSLPKEQSVLFSGWEIEDDAGNKVKLTDLSSTMDPLKLSEKLSYLNLQLMKWNVEPNFDFEKIADTSCLLLGAGTLGCSVSRTLLGWGFRKLTFVDCGIVSYANPLRQSLYTFDDCVKKRPKTEAAVNAVKKINPLIEVSGEHFVIPSLGHGQIRMDNYEKLERLILTHDVIFLLTDSRESRWLPTVISSFHSKITITAALGFDSYLVMRHGISFPDDEKKLGCYFCTDIVAPRNSMQGRPLDQQCTVTRTGVAEIASALAGELALVLLHHPEQGRASNDAECCFGRIPHTIRGFLRDFTQIFPSFENYDKCVACSPSVLSQFGQDKLQFLDDVFSNPNVLENITGITEMKDSTSDEQMLALSDSSE